MAEQFLNQALLANRWQISPRTLERWRWTGEGPAFVKIGGRVIYRLDDILAFENARRCESTVDGTRLRTVQ
jgi:predicted site-specific integrase-resolvase